MSAWTSCSDEIKIRMYREQKAMLYAVLSDILCQNRAADTLIARIASRFKQIDPCEFSATDFKERAYGIPTAHP